MDKSRYKKLAQKSAKKSPLLRDCFFAFLFGGTICLIGQFVGDAFRSLGVPDETVNSLVPITMVFIGALLTALGVYEKLAKYAGAGTIIPITGFANSIVSPAIEFKSEGLVLGMAAKMFVVAGPVLVYGTVASIVYGLIAYALGVI